MGKNHQIIWVSLQKTTFSSIHRTSCLTQLSIVQCQLSTCDSERPLESENSWSSFGAFCASIVCAHLANDLMVDNHHYCVIREKNLHTMEVISRYFPLVFNATADSVDPINMKTNKKEWKGFTSILSECLQSIFARFATLKKSQKGNKSRIAIWTANNYPFLRLAII